MALSYYGSSGDVQGASPVTYVFASAVTNGDWMVAKVQAGSSTVPTVSDNVSSGGNWTLISGTGQTDSTSPYWFFWFKKQMNVTSATAPTVTAVSPGYTGAFNCIAIGGFVGTLMTDATNTNLQTGTTVGAGAANTVQSTTQPGEILLAMWFGASGFFSGIPAPGWSIWPASTWPSVLIGPEPAGTNCNAAYTPNTATYWVQSMVGIYDPGTPTVTLAWING
jgi:hypothetical protein